MSHQTNTSGQYNDNTSRLETSHDKDDNHTIRSAIAENPMLHANVTAVSSIEQELLPIEVLHCGNKEFRSVLLL